MLQNIPTHLIAGPLGAGKTTLIAHLMQQRPSSERWAVLINEFGQIGMDAALLTTADDGIALGEVAGGCLCCVNGAPFQVALGRLLRKARPHRVFIEPSGLGHPLRLLHQLGEPPWRGVLNVQPLVMVLDAAALAAGEPLQQSQSEALVDARLIVMNKAARLDNPQRLRITTRLASNAMLLWQDADELDLKVLPSARQGQVSVLDALPLELPGVLLSTAWTDDRAPICHINDGPEGWSIGWRWRPAVRLDQHALSRWLELLEFRRAKMIIHSRAGWRSANVLDNGFLVWRDSEWRRDSRLELIFDKTQDREALQASVAKLRLD